MGPTALGWATLHEVPGRGRPMLTGFEEGLAPGATQKGLPSHPHPPASPLEPRLLGDGSYGKACSHPGIWGGGSPAWRLTPGSGVGPPDAVLEPRS